jgi:hypothetical protein
MKDDLLDDILKNQPEPYDEEDKILAPLLEEIDLIDDPGILSFVRAVLVKAPSYFWTESSEFTGNYFPPDERFEGGCVLHTKRVVRIVREILFAQDKTQEEIDQAVAAALIHDLTKGTRHPEGHILYDPMHPYTVDALVSYIRMDDNQNSDETRSSTLWISDEHLTNILRMVRCHMGSWSPIPETVPVTNLELTLHLADLLASKLHFLVDGEDIQAHRWEKEE